MTIKPYADNPKIHDDKQIDAIAKSIKRFGCKQPIVVDKDGNPTGWNNMLELNRMAFSDLLPRNSESRALSVAIKLIRKNAPHVAWILSFSDGTLCGDGTIYRASGFKLTNIKKTDNSYLLPGGEAYTAITLKLHGYAGAIKKYCTPEEFYKIVGNRPNSKNIKALMDHIGAKQVHGYQLRYIYIIDKTYKLNCPDLPYSTIDEVGARMYKGVRL